MKVSYKWLQSFFSEPLPEAEELAEALTFHSAEIEEVTGEGDDLMIDVKVLPDKSAWLLSHRGVAKELSAILSRPLTRDPLATPPTLLPLTDRISLTLETDRCDHYSAALMTGVRVAPSPEWLQDRLRTIGQRPINNVVDIANYVMFEMGQPLHAFDADKLGKVGERYAVGVRQAKEGEKLTTLMKEEVVLTESDMVIVDGTNNQPIALAGVKGGLSAAVDENTTTLLIEAAHFDRVSVRKTAQRHNLRTDASQRYENGVPRALAPYGLAQVTALLSELAGGTVVGYTTTGKGAEERSSVSVSLAKINRVLGLSLTLAEVKVIIERLGYVHSVDGEIITIVPPFERDDINIPEDLIEEIGRLYGLTKIVSMPLSGTLPTKINVRHYHAERIRTALTGLGFSEIFTSSFRAKDAVKVKNALASDKGHMRSRLRDNVTEALVRNVPNRDVLGLSAIKVFELGTVFEVESEEYHLCLAVRMGTEYKAKVDDPLLTAAQAAVEAALGAHITWLHAEQGVAECRLSDVLPTLPIPTVYEVSPLPSLNRYQAFSLYPAVSRDIALWIDATVPAKEVEHALRNAVTELCVRFTHIDTFEKDGRVSYAFRLVFQAPDRTLKGEEVDVEMAAAAAAVSKLGGEAR